MTSRAKSKRETKLTQMNVELEQRVDERTAELYESRERLRIITDSLPAAISYVDKDLCYQFNNAAYKAWFRVDPESLKGKRVAEVLGQVAFEKAASFFQKALSGESVGFVQEMPFIHGGTRVVDLRLVPDYDQAGNALGFYVMALDVTQRTRAEEKIKHHQEELTHMGRVHLAGEMSAGIAHELNQPLLAISLQGEICQKMLERVGNREGLDQLATPLTQIVQQAQRAARIINFLRTFLSKSVAHKSTHDLNRIVLEVVDMLSREMKQLEISVHIQTVSDPLLVFVDRVQIQQLLINLLRNACDALQEIPANDRHITISTETLDDNTGHVTVCDNGKGVDSDDLGSIFESFYTSKLGGMGLGLSICKTIAREHHGKLWATQNPDRGTTFHLTMSQSGTIVDDG